MYKIPTDSLYKFSALTGIIVMIFSIYYPFSLITDARNNVTSYNYEDRIAQIELDSFEQFKKKLQNIIANDNKLEINPGNLL